jgi:protoporphyrin/coproporphyrin ferrochelatase
MPEIAVETERHAVLLLAHGTPQTLDEIPAYLRNVTSGRPMPEAVVKEIRHRYSLIGSSPLTELTLEQGSLLRQALGVPVYVGMRNWKPYIADVVRQMRQDGITSAVAICLAPQNSRTSVGLYRRAAFAEAAGAIDMDFIEGWADHPLLAQAFAERLRPVWQSLSARIGSLAPVLFTAHSVPCRTIQAQPSVADIQAQPPVAGVQAQAPVAEGTAATPGPGPDPYPVEAKRTAANVAALLAPQGLTAADWFFAFQSQGMSGATWIGPTVEDTLTALRQEGHTAVVIQPIGFLCDHVEILYDIDIGFKDFAAGIGLEVVRPESLNDSSLLTAALEQLARQGFARLAAKTHSGASAKPVPAL